MDWPGVAVLGLMVWRPGGEAVALGGGEVAAAWRCGGVRRLPLPACPPHGVPPSSATRRVGLEVILDRPGEHTLTLGPCRQAKRHRPHTMRLAIDD